MAILIRSDDTGRIDLSRIGEEYRNRDFGLYRNPEGVIKLVPLPRALPETADPRVTASDPY